jgi:dipeptidyl aminopeptidase/acylaminoacyl peptidase
MFTRILDYLATRPDVDTARVLVYGGSFGGYWAIKVGITERARVEAVVAQSPPVDGAFAPDFLRSAFATKEYLFDRGPALMSMYAGVTTPADLLRVAPANSLVAQGLLDHPMPPMLVIGGVKDTQVPIADIDLLLTTGITPKYAWINPAGGHMGREAQGWTDATIFARITTPWIERQLGVGHAS